MKLYITYIVDRALEEDDLSLAPVWTASQAAAATQRAAFVRAGIPRAKIATDEVEVPTNRTKLLDFLNDHDVRTKP